MINAAYMDCYSYDFTLAVIANAVSYETESAQRLLLIRLLVVISIHLVSVQLSLISIISKHYSIPF